MAALSRLSLIRMNIPPIALRLNPESRSARLCSRCYATTGPNQSQSHVSEKKLEHHDLARDRTAISQQHRSQSVIATKFYDDEANGNVDFRRPKIAMTKSGVFLSHENKYIHNHVQSKLVDFTKLGAMIDSLSIKPLLDEMIRFTEKEHHDEDAYKLARKELFYELKHAIKGMSLEELAILMTSIKDNKKAEITVVKKMIDLEISAQIRYKIRMIVPIQIDFLLYLADVYFQCDITTTFGKDLIRELAEKDNLLLNDKQLMYMLFLVNLQRDHQGFLTRYEGRISKLLDKATFGDICTICLSYFKSRLAIENLALLEKIIDRTIELLPSIDYAKPGYCGVIKCIRYSRNFAVRGKVMKLTEKVTQDPSCVGALGTNFNLTQTAKLMEFYRIYDANMLDYLRDSIFKRTDEFRIKEIQFILTTLSNTSWRNLKLDDSLIRDFDTLCQTIVTESRHDADHQHTHLFAFLRSFIAFGYYNDDFINYMSDVLEEDEKVTRMRGTNFGKSLLLSYAATRIESNGAKLRVSDTLLSEASASNKRMGRIGSVRQDSSFEHLRFLIYPNELEQRFSAQMRSIAKSLLSMEGLNCPKFHYNFQFTMAHQGYADLVISLNQPAPGCYDPCTLMPREIAPDQKHCVVLAVQRFDFMDGRDRLSGLKELIMRLLIRLGYNVVIVNLDEPDIVQLSHQIRSALVDQDMN